MPITLKGYESREFGVINSKAFLDSTIDRDDVVMWLSLYDYPDDLDFDEFNGFFRDDDSVNSTISAMNPDARGVSNYRWYLNYLSSGLEPDRTTTVEREFSFFTSIIKRYPITRDNITIENNDGVVVLNISFTTEIDDDLSIRYISLVGDTEDAFGRYELEGLPHIQPDGNNFRVDRSAFSYYFDFKGNFYQKDYQAMGEEALVDFFCPRQIVSNPNNPYNVDPGNVRTKTSGHYNYEAQSSVMAYMDETAPITTSGQSRPIITTTNHINEKPFYLPILYIRDSGSLVGQVDLLRRYRGSSTDLDVHYNLASSFGVPYYSFNEMYFSSTYPAVSNLTNETINFSNLDGLYCFGSTIGTSYRSDNTYQSDLFPGGVALPKRTVYPLSGITYYVEKLEQDTALVAGDSFSVIIRIELTSL